MLNLDAIELFTSEWAILVLFVPRKDGFFQFCIDCHRLNEATIKATYPLPSFDECIHSLDQAKVSSTLNASSGYREISEKDEDRNRTASVRHAWLYLYKRMPFGLTIAQATFQRGLGIILSGFEWKHAWYISVALLSSQTWWTNIFVTLQIFRKFWKVLMFP